MTRVMIVDDHPMWRDAITRDLDEAGFQTVATASNGEQALRRARAVRPEVVILDLQLPTMTGVEVARHLIQADPTVRVLVLSASGERDDVLAAVKAGATGYLVKYASREESSPRCAEWLPVTPCSPRVWPGSCWESSAGSRGPPPTMSPTHRV